MSGPGITLLAVVVGLGIFAVGALFRWASFDTSRTSGDSTSRRGGRAKYNQAAIAVVLVVAALMVAAAFSIQPIAEYVRKEAKLGSYDKLLAESQDVTTQLGATKEELTEVDGKLQQVTTQLGATKEELTKKEGELAAMRSQLQTQRQNYEKLNELFLIEQANRRSISDQLAAKNSEIQSRDRRLSDIEAKLLAEQRRADELNASLLRLRQQQYASSTETHAGQTTQIRHEVSYPQMQTTQITSSATLLDASGAFVPNTIPTVVNGQFAFPPLVMHPSPMYQRIVSPNFVIPSVVVPAYYP